MTSAILLSPLTPVSAVSASLCTKEGGRVVSRTTSDGSVEYTCYGGQFDGQPVIPVI